LIALARRLFDVSALIGWGGVAGVTVIVFIETGLFFGFFLPGDSLLVTAGILAAAGKLNIQWLVVSASLAAVIGDQTGYVIGRRAGAALVRRHPRFERHLDRAHGFYEKYGAKTIVIARFVPGVRTFVPAVAGAARMDYGRFVTYNVAGGLFWVWSMTLGGYALGSSIPNIERNLHFVIAAVILASLIPVYLEWRKHRK
jgi:membrane-associated protein